MNRLFGGLAKALVFPAAVLGATNTSLATVICGHETLIAADGATSEAFGESVSAFADVLVIGAPRDNDNGQNSGSAYVFHYDLDQLRWVQERKLLPSDGSMLDRFGHSVSVFGDIAVIGALFDDDNGADSGSAYVFRFDGASWNEDWKLLASDGAANDWFGRSVAVSGEHLLVGASGAAYVFRYDSGAAQWVEQQKLLPADGLPDPSFGFSVGISGDTTVVGAPMAEVDGSDSGAAYVFRFNGSSWEQEHKLVADDGASGDSFGYSVAVDDDTVVIGAWFDDDNGNASGSAYVFRLTDSGWGPEQKILASDGTQGDVFGESVAIRSDVILVGSFAADNSAVNSGAAYVFRYDSKMIRWVEDRKLIATVGASGDLLGSSVSVLGDTAIIGAPGTDDNGVSSGSVYLFDLAAEAEFGLVLYVDDGAAADGDGTSWTAACRHLQDALAVASDTLCGRTEIRVAQGTYTPDRDAIFPGGSGDQDATFQLISGVELRGGYAGPGAPDPDARDIHEFETVLSGDLDANDGPGFANYSENSHHVVTGSNTDRTAVLDGFTISGGNATGFGFGGGIFTDSGSPTVIWCRFAANAATFGGAMNNQANSSPAVMHCVFAGNQAGTGAGIRNDEGSSPMVYRCVFTGNVADRGGAGIYSERNCNPTVIACEFIGNSALGTDPFSGGGAVHNNFLVNSTFINCTFVNNSAVLGGAMMNRDGKGFGPPDTTIINCTFAGNTAESSGGGMSVLAGGPEVTNCVFWYNAPDQIRDEPGTFATVNYSNVQGGWPGAGSNNIDAEPMLVDPDIGDVRLSPGSPCIDAGDNTAVPGAVTSDAGGNPRFVDDPDTPDTGNPGAPGPIVDMGAYELQEINCLADIDNNGVVEPADLAMLIAVFGTADPDADVNYDGTVNVLDLIELLLAFGALCPSR